VQRDDVGAGEQILELHLLDADVARALGAEEGVEGDDAHPQADWDTGHFYETGNKLVVARLMSQFLRPEWYRKGLRITAFEVDHAPIAPAYAYRFDYKGRSVFVTGDLKFRPSLASAAKGADLMVSEAIAVSMTRALGKGAGSAGRSNRRRRSPTRPA
jgi:hypothetical protein